MKDVAGPAVLLAAVIVLGALAFITLWVRDRGRAHEQSHDPERARTDAHLPPGSREGSAEEPSDVRTERRH